MVVPLFGDLEVYLDDYLKKKYPNEGDRELVRKSHDVWYGIIDGCQFHQALLELREEDPDLGTNYLEGDLR